MNYIKTLKIFVLLTFLVSCSSSDSPITEDPCDGNCGTIVVNETPGWTEIDSCPYWYLNDAGGFVSHGGSSQNCYHVRIENDCSGEIRSFIYYNDNSVDIDMNPTGDYICNYQ